MSVATANPFAILEAEDPSRPATPAPPPPSHDSPQAQPPSTRGTQKARGGPASRGGRYYARGGKFREPNNEEPAAMANTQKKFGGEGRGEGRGERGERGERGDGRGRGRGRGRGDRNRAGADGGGRGRQFDKHSQTGRTDSDKKIHQSWGGDDGPTEFRVEEAATVDAAVESTTDWAGAGEATNDWAGGATNDWAGGATNDWAPAPAADDQWATPIAAPDTPAAEADTADKVGGEREQRRRDRDPEEEDTTLTLTQYLAQKKEKETVPKLEGVRKANEGADDTIWKDAIPLKKEEGALFVGKTKSTHKTRAKKEEKVFLEIDAHFERPSRGGRGRGGDRGDRPFRGGGGRGRGGPRRPNGSEAVNVDDEAAFPSLS